MPLHLYANKLIARFSLASSACSRWSKELLHHQCQLCQLPSDHALCEYCVDQLHRLGNACSVCANPLQSSTQQICGDCLKNPKPFRQIVASFTYEPPLDRLIRRFKHGHPHPLGAWFAGYMLENLQQRYTQQVWPDLLVPVPSHFRKQFLRGYNPAQHLSQTLAKNLNIRSQLRVRRTKQRTDQKRLNRESRLKNLQHAFQCDSTLRGSNIAIVDDVVTTAATAMAVTDCLKRAGAGWIDIWCLARTP